MKKTLREIHKHKNILAPTDGSAFSDKAVKEAAELAKELGSKLVVFYAVPQYQLPPLTEGLSTATSRQEKERAQKALEAHAQAVLASAAQKAKLPNGTLDRHFVVSNCPYAAILDAAKKFKCDLIVMASHGIRGVSGLLLGSETQKVLIHSKIPVLVVR